MGMTEPSVAEALSQAHATLLDDLRELEEAARPAAGDGLAALCARLGATQARLTEHFRFEEHDGYMHAVRERVPRLERTIQHLADEHGQLAQSLDDLLRESAAATSLAEPLRRQVRAWIERVRHHEARENDVVHEAFNRDIGTMD
jgi:hypothetical protein